MISISGLLATGIPCAAAVAQVPDTVSMSVPEPPPSPVAMPAGASFTNPAISVIGWLQAVAGNDPAAQEEPFELREAEIAFQAAIDPFSRADFFLAAGHEGLEVEEGYLTWLALPGGGQARLGKFRAAFGKFNATHPPETPFADRPLAPLAFLGEEGLATTGLWVSALVPNPAGLYWDLIANVGSVPEPDHSPLFEPVSRSDVLVVGRTSLFVPLGESTDLNLGASYVNARAQEPLRIEGDRAQVGVADVTLRWKNPRRSIYRSLTLQGEWMGERGSAEDATTRTGALGYALYQFARQWTLGARYDWTERPDAPEHASGVLALLQFRPSEFSTLSLQARRVRDAALDQEFDSAFFKWTFNIGPHGAHPY